MCNQTFMDQHCCVTLHFLSDIASQCRERYGGDRTKKNQTERKGAPAFQIIVEVQGFADYNIHMWVSSDITQNDLWQPTECPYADSKTANSMSFYEGKSFLLINLGLVKWSLSYARWRSSERKAQSYYMAWPDKNAGMLENQSTDF